MHGDTKVFIAAVSSLMVLLAACGNNPSTGSSAAGKTLVIDHAYAWDFSKDNDPSRGGVDFEADPFFHAIYDSLLTFKLGDSSTPIPLVAQSYTVSPDAKTFTFTIRKDVKFADGTPLNARDVEFTYNQLRKQHSPHSCRRDTADRDPEGIEPDRAQPVRRPGGKPQEQHRAERVELHFAEHHFRVLQHQDLRRLCQRALRQRDPLWHRLPGLDQRGGRRSGSTASRPPVPVPRRPSALAGGQPSRYQNRQPNSSHPGDPLPPST